MRRPVERLQFMGKLSGMAQTSPPTARELSTLAARKLAEQFGGDCGAADWRHFGRLSGLTNRKAKYMTEGGLFPFVRLTRARRRDVRPQG